MYQGLIRTCWHPVVLITEEQITDTSRMSEENFDTSDRKVSYKDYIPFWTYLFGSSSVRVINTLFQYRVQYHTLHIRKTIMFSICYYRPPAKLREGNVFTRVCLFMGGDHYPWCIGPHSTETPGHAPLLKTSGSHQWRPVQTCML